MANFPGRSFTLESPPTLVKEVGSLQSSMPCLQSHGSTVEILPFAESAHLQLQAALRLLLRSAAEDIPELLEALENVLTLLGDAQGRGSQSELRLDQWRLEGYGGLHQLLVSPTLLGEDAETIAAALLHQLAHLLAGVQHLRATSNRGRYHNKHCAHSCEMLGLSVEYDRPYGWRVTGLGETLRARLARSLQELDVALVLQPSVQVDMRDVLSIDLEAEKDCTGSRKYIFASCLCADSRGRPQPIRVASGRWSEHSIFCQLCGSWFTDPQSANHFDAPSPRLPQLDVALPVKPSTNKEAL
jgi:hypothetical protein